MPAEPGKRIRELRWDAHLKQVDLAERAGIAQNTLSQIELGNQSPSVATLEKIAGVLGVDVSAFLAETSPPWALVAGEEEFAEWLKRAPREDLQRFFGKDAGVYADAHPDDAELLIRVRDRAQAALDEYLGRAGGVAGAIFRPEDGGESESVQDPKQSKESA
jgi:transcriptional regulator with XRE-family HTH domain